MNAATIDRATHALSEIVPCMRTAGFMVLTDNGPFRVPPGDDAERFADLLAHFQQLALIRAQCAEQLAPTNTVAASAERDAMGFLLNSSIIGDGCAHPAFDAHRPAALPCRADSSERSAAPQSQAPTLLAQPGATPQTPGGHQ